VLRSNETYRPADTRTAPARLGEDGRHGRGPWPAALPGRSAAWPDGASWSSAVERSLSGVSPRCWEPGALVTVVSPVVRPAIEGMAASVRSPTSRAVRGRGPRRRLVRARADRLGRGERRPVVAEADAHRIFCVRADDATGWQRVDAGVGPHGQVTVRSRPTETRAGPPRSVTRSSAPCATGSWPTRTVRGARPEWCWSAAAPGDPELVTLAGRRALFAADVVVADRLAPRALLDELPAHVEVVDVSKLPRGRSPRRTRSTRCAWSGRWRVSGWCASRVATASCSAAATRRRWPARRPEWPGRWCPASPARSACLRPRGSRSTTEG
jgi:hypothetical protein